MAKARFPSAKQVGGAGNPSNVRSSGGSGVLGRLQVDGCSTLSFGSVSPLPSKSASFLWETITNLPELSPVVVSLWKHPFLSGVYIPVGKCPGPTCSTLVHEHLYSSGSSATLGTDSFI